MDGFGMFISGLIDYFLQKVRKSDTRKRRLDWLAENNQGRYCHCRS